MTTKKTYIPTSDIHTIIGLLPYMQARFFVRKGNLHYLSPNPNGRTKIKSSLVTVENRRLPTKAVIALLTHAKLKSNPEKQKYTPKTVRKLTDFFLYNSVVYSRATNQPVDDVSENIVTALSRQYTRTIDIQVNKEERWFSVNKSYADDIDGFKYSLLRESVGKSYRYPIGLWDAFTFYIAGRYLTPVVTQS